jgi:hypothetical protein
MPTEQVERLADGILARARARAARRPDEQTFMRAICQLVERTFPDYRDRGLFGCLRQWIEVYKLSFGLPGEPMSAWPSVDESANRLRRAGWSAGDVGHGGGVGRLQHERGKRYARPGPDAGRGVAPGLSRDRGPRDAGQGREPKDRAG